jgi:Holliday junction resolvase RusA-like endonuclease
MQEISFLAPFKALPQGSKTAFVVKGRAVLTEAHKGLIPARKKLSAWLKAAAVDSDWIPPTKNTPISVELIFTFERPKSVKREFHTVKPDADKLTRFAIDAIVQADLIEDDNQIVNIVASKVYGGSDSIWLAVSHE